MASREGATRGSTAVKESDIVHLILSFLEEAGLASSILAVEEETGISNGDWSPGSNLAFLRKSVIQGKWDDLLLFFEPWADLSSASAKEHVKAQIIIEKQRLMEYLFSHPDSVDIMKRPSTMEKAQADLNQVVREMLATINRLRALCSDREFDYVMDLVNLIDFRKNAEYMKWTPARGRLRIFIDLRDVYNEVMGKQDSEHMDRLNNSAKNMMSKSSEPDRLTTLVLMGSFYEDLQRVFQQRCLGASQLHDQCSANEFLVRRPPMRVFMETGDWKNFTLCRDVANWLKWIPDQCYKEPYRSRAHSERTYTVVPVHGAIVESMKLRPRMRHYTWHGMDRRPAEITQQEAATKMKSMSDVSIATRPNPGCGGKAVHEKLLSSHTRSGTGHAKSQALSLTGKGNGLTLPVLTADANYTAMPISPAPVQKSQTDAEFFKQPYGSWALNLVEREKHLVRELEKQSSVQAIQGQREERLAKNGLTTVKKPKKLTAGQDIAVKIGLSTKEELLRTPAEPTRPDTSMVEAMEGGHLPQSSTWNKTVVVVRDGVAENGLQVSNVKKFKLLGQYEEPKTMRAIGISPTGLHFAAGTNNGSLHIFNLPVGRPGRDEAVLPCGLLKPVRSLHNVHRASVYSLDWAVGGRLVATSSNDREVKVTNILEDDGSLRRTLANHTSLVARHGDTVRCVKFCRTSRYSTEQQLVSCSSDKPEAIITDVYTGHQIHALTHGNHGFIAVDAVMGEPLLWAATAGQELLLFDMRAGSKPVEAVTSALRMCTFRRSQEGILSCITATDRHVAVGFNSGHCAIVDRRAKQWIGPIPTHRAECRAVHLSDMYKGVMVSAGFDYNVCVSSCYKQAGEPWQYDVRTVGQHAGRVVNACWSPGDRYVLSSGTDRLVRLWLSNL